MKFNIVKHEILLLFCDIQTYKIDNVQLTDQLVN